jgi:hypothetical protein
VFEIAGNAPTVPASVSETFCSVSGVHAKRDWSWTGKFEATLSGKGASRTLTIKVDDSTARAGRIYVMRNSAGQVIARVKANGTGDISTTVSGKKIVSGSRISLYLRNALIATDAA